MWLVGSECCESHRQSFICVTLQNNTETRKNAAWSGWHFKNRSLVPRATTRTLQTPANADKRYSRMRLKWRIIINAHHPLTSHLELLNQNQKLLKCLWVKRWDKDRDYAESVAFWHAVLPLSTKQNNHSLYSKPESFIMRNKGRTSIVDPLI